MLKYAATASAALLCACTLRAQTDVSLFWRADSVQVAEIVSAQPVQYGFVGHHGPAVENSHFALRIYFNDSGAVDLYSKSGARMELLEYLWYPTGEQQREEGAGRDEYLTGRTLGLGGIALWDGEEVLPLKATNGRTARVGRTRGGAFAEMIAYGVPYRGGFVDISLRIEMKNRGRDATITASELGGREVQFVTGVNYPEGAEVECGRKYVAVWGAHPADVSREPFPIGAGMRFRPGRFESVPARQVRERRAASRHGPADLEARLGNQHRGDGLLRDRRRTGQCGGVLRVRKKIMYFHNRTARRPDNNK